MPKFSSSSSSSSSSYGGPSLKIMVQLLSNWTVRKGPISNRNIWKLASWGWRTTNFSPFPTRRDRGGAGWRWTTVTSTSSPPWFEW